MGRKPVDIGRGSWLFGRYRSRVVFLSRLLSTPCSQSSGLYPFILLRNILLLTIKSGRCAAKIASAPPRNIPSEATPEKKETRQARDSAMNTIALINTRAEGKAEVPGAALAHPTRQHARDVRATTTGSSGSRRHDYERDKAQEKAADIQRMKRKLFESNKSTDPSLVPGIVSQSVPLMTTVGQH